MEFDLDKKGKLKILFYKECKETAYENGEATPSCSGELTGLLDNNVVSVKHKSENTGRFIGEISRKFFNEAFPSIDFGQFTRTSYGGLRILVGHISQGNLYETDLRDTDDPLQRHLDCLARVVRGERKQKKGFSF